MTYQPLLEALSRGEDPEPHLGVGEAVIVAGSIVRVVRVVPASTWGDPFICLDELVIFQGVIPESSQPVVE